MTHLPASTDSVTIIAGQSIDWSFPELSAAELACVRAAVLYLELRRDSLTIVFRDGCRDVWIPAPADYPRDGSVEVLTLDEQTWWMPAAGGEES